MFDIRYPQITKWQSTEANGNSGKSPINYEGQMSILNWNCKLFSSEKTWFIKQVRYTAILIRVRKLLLASLQVSTLQWPLI